MIFTSTFWGMNFIWWIVWMIIIFWIFVTPYDIPGQRRKKDSALDILEKRFAAGEISTDDYKKRKKLLSKDFSKLN